MMSPIRAARHWFLDVPQGVHDEPRLIERGTVERFPSEFASPPTE
jgi:hypothetical protein